MPVEVQQASGFFEVDGSREVDLGNNIPENTEPLVNIERRVFCLVFNTPEAQRNPVDVWAANFEDRLDEEPTGNHLTLAEEVAAERARKLVEQGKMQNAVFGRAVGKRNETGNYVFERVESLSWRESPDGSDITMRSLRSPSLTSIFTKERNNKTKKKLNMKVFH